MVGEEIEYFFEKYKEFLSYESVVSLLKGREYRIIQFFYQLFMEISKKKINIQKVSKIKGKLESLLKEYKDENEIALIKLDCKNPSYVRMQNISDKELGEAFETMIEATRQYMKWRKSLPEEAIREIYLKNLRDRQTKLGIKIDYF